MKFVLSLIKSANPRSERSDLYCSKFDTSWTRDKINFGSTTFLFFQEKLRKYSILTFDTKILIMQVCDWPVSASCILSEFVSVCYYINIIFRDEIWTFHGSWNVQISSLKMIFGKGWFCWFNLISVFRYSVKKKTDGFTVDMTLRICFPDGDVLYCVPNTDGLPLVRNQFFSSCVKNETSLKSKLKKKQ